MTSGSILSSLRVVLLSVAASAQSVPDNGGFRAQVRRHGEIESGKLFHSSFSMESALARRDTEANVVTMVSPQGTIAREGNYSRPETIQRSSGPVARYDLSTESNSERQWTEFTHTRIARMVRSHTRPHSIWRVALLAKRAWRKRHEDALPATERSIGAQDLRNWTASFLLSLLFLGFISTYLGGKLKTSPQPEDDLVGARGRACWTYCCAGSVVFLSILTFFLTLVVLSAPKLGSTDASPGPKHPGERAFEAGEGVALSVACFALIIFRRRQAASLQISSGLISQFAIRGATLSVIFAGAIEIFGIYGMNYVSGISVRKLVPSDKSDSGDGPAVYIAAVMMGMVGIAEELSKALVLICGTWIDASALRRAWPAWYATPWRVLVETPRGIMLAGLGVGCGFMTMENVGYLMSTGAMYDKNDSALVERVVRCVIVATRVGLNLHPWLAAITSARIARLCFEDRRSMLSLSLSELAWSMAPSVVLHGLFDFSLTTMPGLLAMFLPLVFWCIARSLFDREWNTFECSHEASDPVEDTPQRAQNS